MGDGVLDIPSAVRRQVGMRENLPIEVKFFRRVVEDADPYIFLRCSVLRNRGHQNIIDADMEQRRKNDQIVNGGQCRAVLPFVDGLGRIETENHLQVVNGQACGLSQINNIGAGLRQIDGWNRQPKHLLF